MTASRDRVEAERLRRKADRRARFSVVPSATVAPSAVATASPARDSQLQPLRRPVERRAAVGPIVAMPAAPAPPMTQTTTRKTQPVPVAPAPRDEVQAER